VIHPPREVLIHDVDDVDDVAFAIFARKPVLWWRRFGVTELVSRCHSPYLSRLPVWWRESQCP
jgi:hypothetical protein